MQTGWCLCLQYYPDCIFIVIFKKANRLSKSICALCLKNVPLQKSHVIPDSIFKRIFRTNSGKGISFSTDEDSSVEYTSDSWSEPLLCEGCESALNEKYENYSLALLRGAKGKVLKHEKGVTFSDVDLVTFHLFVISIFWRSAVSQHYAFQKVFIPEPWKDKVRLSLYAKISVPVSRISVKISRLIDKSDNGFSLESLKQIVLSPFFRDQKERFSFCFLFEGFFIEILFPGLRFSERSKIGIIYPNRNGFMAPYLSIFDVPEIFELLVAGYKKNELGKVKIKR